MPFEIALPDSSLSDCSDLRQRTMKIGLLARAIAVFRIEKVIIYETNHGEKYQRDLILLDKILRYMDTPQYLRRSVFPMSPSLKYAGILPPLRIRSHPLASTIPEVRDGEVRWGIQGRPGLIDIGLDEPIEYEHPIRTRVPIIFRITKSRTRLNLEPTTRDTLDYYFGYEVEKVSNLIDYLANDTHKTSIVFSRSGTPFQRISSEIKSVLESTKNLIGIFGGPHSGVRELVQDRDALKDHIDFWINMIPDQGTETVRLEEAVWTSLGQFNSSFGNVATKSGYYEH